MDRRFTDGRESYEAYGEFAMGSYPVCTGVMTYEDNEHTADLLDSGLLCFWGFLLCIHIFDKSSKRRLYLKYKV